MSELNIVLRQTAYIEVPEDDFVDYFWELGVGDDMDDGIIMSLELFLDEFIFEPAAEGRCERFAGFYEWLLKVEEAINDIEADPEDVDLIFHIAE